LLSPAAFFTSAGAFASTIGAPGFTAFAASGIVELARRPATG
jgi:hypothetical protein